MTGFWRNAEVRRTLLLSLALSAAAGLGGLFLGWRAALYALGVGIAMSTVQLAVTYRRYRNMARLAAEIDRILHGGEIGCIRGMREGELAILTAEVQKMTLRLRGHEQQLMADKAFLADALADISHQLRTPLTSLHLLTSLLSERGLDEHRRIELLGELRTLLSRIDWLVDALLKLSKLDAGTVTLRRDAIFLQELLAKSCEPLQIAAELRGIALCPEAQGDVTCDMAWTAESLGNIVKNCMEHTPSGGTIRLHAQENPLFSEIIITDTGSGIASEDLPHIFERFYRGKHADKVSFGIGLALARTVITAQGGTIKAENRPEGGAKFVIRFYKSTV